MRACFMRFRSGRVLLLAGMALLGACSGREEAAPSSAAAEAPADLVLNNARVYTVDGSRRVAEAVAIRGNRIVAVGTGAEVGALIGPATEVRDLGGRMVMPGIHDTHVHAIGTVQPEMCDFRGEGKSLDDMVPFLKDCLVRYGVPPGQWMPVLQWPFAVGNQPSARYPTLRAALD